MKNVINSYVKIALAIILISLTGSFANAQTLGSLHLPSGLNQNKELLIEEGIDMEEALNRVEEQFRVVFLYRTDTMEGKKVKSAKVLPQNVKQALEKLLEGQGLSFKYLNPKTYGIYERNQPAVKKEVLPVQEQITGTVTDASSGETLPGVNILVKGTSTGASTDENGYFDLEVPSLQDTLIVSYIGYQSQEVPINGRSEIDIVLQPQAIAGDEVVVVGYGTAQKSSLTSSISKVDNEKLDQIPTSRVEDALRGRMSGVSVVNPRSTPGAAPNIRIRGAGSIDAGNDPLIVIDGYPGGDLGQLNMNDVESIEVLKDASAAAIYGSRGAGGVILVTTKSGQEDSGARLSYNGHYGISSPMLHGDWLTGEEWYEYLVKYQNREFAWAGGDTDLPMHGNTDRPEEYQVNPLTYQLPQTVWEEEITQLAPIQNHSLSLSGGSENVGYYVSVNYTDEEGAVKTASYRRFGLRGNLDIEVNEKLDVGVNINPSFSKRRIAGSAMNSLSKYPPFVPPSDENIDYYPRTQDYIPRGHSGQASPYTYLYGTRNFNEISRNQGQVFANLELVEGLELRSSFGATLTFNYTDYFRAPLGDPSISTYGQDLRTRNMNLINENTLTYTRNFRKNHEISVLLGASYQSSESTISQLRSETGSYTNEVIHTINNAIVNPGSSTSLKTDWGMISYFTRLNYNFNRKYLLSAVFRTDGSSRFGANDKWGNFPSLSLAWRISEENFIRDVSAIEELKLRASYGVTGNNNIGNYTYLGTISPVAYSPGNVRSIGQAQSGFENQDLTWERTIGLGFGADLSTFNNRFNITIDYYDNRTTDLLYNINTPAITGFSSTISNIGEVRNYGFEFELLTKNMVGSFDWNTSFNFSRNYNEVVDLGEVDERISSGWTMDWILREGEPMFSYYGYRIQGIYNTEEEIANSPSLSGAKPGNPIIADRNNDGQINENDKEILGNFQPKYILGMVNDFSWKGFDLSIAMYASLGAKMFNAETQYYQGNTLGAMRRPVVENQWWSPEEPGDGKTPAAALSQLFSFNANTDYYIENASYFTIRNLNLGYSLPTGIANKFLVRGLRVYTSINNLLMITSEENNSYNPEGFTSGEINGPNSTPGFNTGAEPINRVYTIGLNIDF